MRYLLVEHPEPWPGDGFDSTGLPADVRREVMDRAADLGAAVLLIRRPLRHQSPVCLLRSWCAIDTEAPAGQRVRWGAWSYPADLLAGIDRLAELAAGPGADLGHAGPDDPVLLVGGPTYELSRRWPEATWESTHPGLLLLPHGRSCDTAPPDLADVLAEKVDE